MLDADKYAQLLLQYAQQHTRTTATNDTAHPIGSGHVFELVHPDLGYWIDRFRLYLENNRNRNMGDDYNHSTFIDLILSGLFGLRARADDTVEVNPLFPSTLEYCAADHISYHGHVLSIVWDKDGTHYRKGSGLGLWIDGALAVSAPTVQRITAKL